MGFFLDIIFPIKIFESVLVRYFGVLVVLFATFLIFWAQRTSRNLDKSNLTKESFQKGPYNFTRGPTHLGLFLLIIGFGFVANTIFVIFFTVVAFFITKLVFLKEQEMLLEERYGDPYREYKKSVRF
jgi:protein-S-isoprenylcysteine O-methyltransferase Ste14